ncbi:MAG: DVUA0089 family protein [Treponema sp.]|jgi:TolB-like protein|nr:DVUA0089 family protein [Treponema sp.]
MKKLVCVFMFVALCGAVYGQKKAVAVSLFNNGRGISAESANTITNLVIGRLSDNGMVELVDRASFDKIVEEMRFQQSDWANKERTAALGAATSADYIIRGEIDLMDGLIIVTARMIDILTAKVVASSDIDMDRMNQARSKMPEFVDRFIQTLTRIEGQNITPSAPVAPSGQSAVYVQGQGTANDPIAATVNGPWITRSLDSRHGEDWFRITVSSSALLVMETDGNVDTYIELYDPALSLLDENDDGGDDSNAKVSRYSEGNQTYLVKVRGYNSDTSGSYQFHVVTDMDRSEPNNSIREATALSLEIPVSANLSPPGDTDWYRVTVPSGGRDFFAYTEGGLDTKLYLYDNQGTLIAEDDDSGPGRNACIEITANPGTMYLRVEEYSNEEAGPYVLNTGMQDHIPVDRFENDNTRSSAKDIQAGNPQSRTFTNASDIDWVRLVLRSGGTYDIRSVAVMGELDTCLKLYDNNENLIAEDDDGGENYDAYISYYLNPGTYFIEVSNLNGGPLGNLRQYTLIVSKR